MMKIGSVVTLYWLPVCILYRTVPSPVRISTPTPLASLTVTGDNWSSSA